MNACITEHRPDSYIERRYAEWQKASQEFVDTTGGTEAEREARDQSAVALHDFLAAQATTIEGVLFKLRVALDYEDYLFVALDSRNGYAAPRLVVAVAHDLQAMILRKHASATPPRMALSDDIMPAGGA